MRGPPPDLAAEIALEAGLRLRAVRAITRRPAGLPCRPRRAACKGAVRLCALEQGHTGVVGRAVGIRRAGDLQSGEEVGTEKISAGAIAEAVERGSPGRKRCLPCRRCCWRRMGSQLALEDGRSRGRDSGSRCPGIDLAGRPACRWSRCMVHSLGRTRACPRHRSRSNSRTQLCMAF